MKPLTDTLHEEVAEKELVEGNPDELVDPVEQQPNFIASNRASLWPVIQFMRCWLLSRLR